MREPGNDAAVSEGPDIEGLRRFVRETDRSDPPFFVGRTEEIGEIRQRLGDCIRGWRTGKKGAWKGRTTLIQGAPGAGKTALLDHLKERLPGEFEDFDLQVCQLKPKALGDSGYWQHELGRALAPDKWDEMRKDAERRYGIRLEAGGGAVAGETSSRQPASPSAWSDLKDFVAKETASEKPGRLFSFWKKTPAVRPVLLLIDEVQRVEKDKETIGFLGDTLHDSTEGLPIFPVYGGLAWSRRHFKSMDLSRLSGGYVRTLEPLSEAECRDAVAGFFAKFRVRGDEPLKRRWADEIARECQGWPQHLQTHLQSLAAGLVRADLDAKGDLDALEQFGGAPQVRERAEAKRAEQYGDRLDHSVLSSRRALAAVVASCFSGDSQSAEPHVLARAVREASDAEDDPDSPLRLPQGTTPPQFVAAMIRAGVLHEDLEGRLNIPIPSFRQYLTDKYGAARPADAHEKA